jgi:hypothetical protein
MVQCEKHDTDVPSVTQNKTEVTRPSNSSLKTSYLVNRRSSWESSREVGGPRGLAVLGRRSL